MFAPNPPSNSADAKVAIGEQFGQDTASLTGIIKRQPFRIDEAGEKTVAELQTQVIQLQKLVAFQSARSMQQATRIGDLERTAARSARQRTALRHLNRRFGDYWKGFGHAVTAVRKHDADMLRITVTPTPEIEQAYKELRDMGYELRVFPVAEVKDPKVAARDFLDAVEAHDKRLEGGS